MTPMIVDIWEELSSIWRMASSERRMMSSPDDALSAAEAVKPFASSDDFADSLSVSVSCFSDAAVSSSVAA